MVDVFNSPRKGSKASTNQVSSTTPFLGTFKKIPQELSNYLTFYFHLVSKSKNLLFNDVFESIHTLGPNFAESE
jgi:hypothetical protein